jgi:hypothetical protein
VERELWDVIVCGGGTAGAVAGVAAAREGARTLVVEEFGALGGTQTLGWVTPMMSNAVHGTELCAGLDAEIRRRHAAVHPGEDQAWFNPQALAVVLDELAAEHGTSLLYHASVTNLTRRGDGWAVQVSQGDARMEARAAVVLDCTGDADGARLAGAELMSGDEDGRHQPATLRFTMANVDLHAVAADLRGLGIPCRTPLLEAGFAEATESPLAARVTAGVAEGVLGERDLGYFQFFPMLGRPGELAFNCPRLAGVDGATPRDVSRAQVTGRAKIARIARFCQRQMPGFQNAYVGVVAPMLGVRETRRVVGEHVLTEEECLSAAKCADPIARYYDIPYRCLVPRGVDNLLVAGRCLSASFNAQASARIQPVCRAMGEAAGVAAALCAKAGVSPRDLPYADLRARLDHWGLFPDLSSIP